VEHQVIQKRFGIEIYGYTYKSNIRINSIPEIPLTKILIEHSYKLNSNILDNFIDNFKFRSTDMLKKSYPSIEEYYILENTVDDPSPMDRVRLIFYHEKLIAIVHTRDMSVTNTISIDLVRGRKLMIIDLPNKFKQDEFVENNIHAYDGLD
jgi:hypothetical protein